MEEIELHHYYMEYALLEKEFCDTLPYLTLDICNKRAFSHAYVKILLQVGSLIDNVMKLFCRLLLQDIKIKTKYEKNLNINAYKKYIGEYCLEPTEPKFYEQKIFIKISETYITPWENWNKGSSPVWWDIYNKLKHNRFEKIVIENTKKRKMRCYSYKCANQEYTVLALGGLYQTIVYTYFQLQKKNNEKETPKILTSIFAQKSKLFNMKGNFWASVTNISDTFLIKEKRDQK